MTNISNRKRFLLACYFELGLLVLAVVLGDLFRVPVLLQLEWQLKDFALGILAALPMLALVLPFLRLNWQPVINLRHLLETRLLPWLSDFPWWQLAILSIVAGISEEFFFRGFIQGKFVEMGGVLLGVLAASVLFGLAHLVTNTYGILAVLIGMYLGWLLIWSKNLLLPITTHAVYDLVLLVLLARKRPDGQLD